MSEHASQTPATGTPSATPPTPASPATASPDGPGPRPIAASPLHITEPRPAPLLTPAVLKLCAWGVALGVLSGLVAQGLTRIINLFTNICYYGSWSTSDASPAGHHLGLWAVLVPVAGGLVIGVMARYGSAAIRGHGIPEAMEQVLTNQAKIAPRMTWLKPLSAAVAIGTGGPFGAEGPIIATGGAVGSTLGQLLHVTVAERKTLLACGAAGGMAAIFNTPVSAVLLAVELLLFEFRARSLVPVALAAATASCMRIAFVGTTPAFDMPLISAPTGSAVTTYIAIGGLMGLASVAITRALYAIEDAFHKLPLHWMWWPALGGLVVGIVGYFEPLTLGVGYSNISHLVSGKLLVAAAAGLITLKFLSWSLALGSGTSGGTLAPLFTIGAGLGYVIGSVAENWFPGAGIDPRVAALVGMAALFAGASRAFLASVVFAFETTLQPLGLLPLLGGCSMSFVVSVLLMPTSLMTEKIARRGVRVPADYSPDYLDQVPVHAAMSAQIVTLSVNQTIDEVRTWINSNEPGSTHQGYPVVDGQHVLAGVLTRRDLLAPAASGKTLAMLIRRPPIVVYSDCTLRDAADHMVRHDIGRLPVIDRATRQLVGMVTRSDLLSAHRDRLHESETPQTALELPWLRPQPKADP